MHPADITIADFWKIDSAIPGFNDDKGVSLVLINNEKGEKVFDLIKKDLIYQTSTVEKCMMSTMQRPFSKPEDREEFWDSYLKKDFDFMAKKYGEYGLINVFKRSFKLGITPEFLDILENGFKEFFKKEVPESPLKAEYLIPIFIGELLSEGKMSVKVLKTDDTWYGMTYHEDVAAVKDSFKKMLEKGVYKADLFSDL